MFRRLTHSRGYRVKQRDLAYSLCSFQITRALEEHHALYESSRRAAAGPAGPGPGVYRRGVSVHPPAGDSRKPWGAANGRKAETLARNQEIYRRYREGTSVDQLAEAYFLAPKSIWKIIARLRNE
uniref:Mor transcription activator family protein n=1 Tax=Dysosmobacter welbionis TaxID=2093857 RepID=UPI00307B9731